MTSFAFLANNTFMKVPTVAQSDPFAIAGVAWDGSVTNRPDARFGPWTIREASFTTKVRFTLPFFGLLGKLVASGKMTVWPKPVSKLRIAAGRN